jgi:protein DGCR14
MPPPASRVAGATTLTRRAAPQRVLDEDEWTLCLEEIVERDYFPDLPRLKNRLDWLEATRSGDPEKIRDAQLRIQARVGVAWRCAQ